MPWAVSFSAPAPTAVAARDGRRGTRSTRAARASSPPAVDPAANTVTQFESSLETPYNQQGHSRALRRSVETRCRVTPKRSAICSIVMPSACSACASARRTFAPLVSSAFELSVSSWTMSGLSSPETSSVYDAPLERDATELGDPLLDQACTPAVVGKHVLKRGQSVKEFVFGHWLRSVATIRKDPNRATPIAETPIAATGIAAIAIAAMTIARYCTGGVGHPLALETSGPP